jgi:hypothetical protein
VKDRRRLAIIESKAEKYFADLPDTRALVWEVVGPYLLKNEDPQEAS